MEQKAKVAQSIVANNKPDLNTAISDYLLKKGYTKSLAIFSEELENSPKSNSDPYVDKEQTGSLLLTVWFFHERE